MGALSVGGLRDLARTDALSADERAPLGVHRIRRRCDRRAVLDLAGHRRRLAAIPGRHSRHGPADVHRAARRFVAHRAGRALLRRGRGELAGRDAPDGTAPLEHRRGHVHGGRDRRGPRASALCAGRSGLDAIAAPRRARGILPIVPGHLPARVWHRDRRKPRPEDQPARGPTRRRERTPG